MLLSFFAVDKIPDINEEKFMWSYDFRGFSPWSVGSFALRPKIKQKYHGWSMCRMRQLFSRCWA